MYSDLVQLLPGIIYNCVSNLRVIDVCQRCVPVLCAGVVCRCCVPVLCAGVVCYCSSTFYRICMNVDVLLT